MCCPPRVTPLPGCGGWRCPPTTIRTSRSMGQREPSQVHPAPIYQQLFPSAHTTSSSRSRSAGGSSPCRSSVSSQPSVCAPSSQVTKKRASANKKNQETREFYSAAQTVARNQAPKPRPQPSDQSQAARDQLQQRTADANACSSSPAPPDAVTVATAEPHYRPRQNAPVTGHTPGSASKKKHRKLAVNFKAAKVSE